jgi:hypothetical protein
MVSSAAAADVALSAAESAATAAETAETCVASVLISLRGIIDLTHHPPFPKRLRKILTLWWTRVANQSPEYDSVPLSTFWRVCKGIVKALRRKSRTLMFETWSSIQKGFAAKFHGVGVISKETFCESIYGIAESWCESDATIYIGQIVLFLTELGPEVFGSVWKVPPRSPCEASTGTPSRNPADSKIGKLVEEGRSRAMAWGAARTEPRRPAEGSPARFLLTLPASERVEVHGQEARPDTRAARPLSWQTRRRLTSSIPRPRTPRTYVTGPAPPSVSGFAESFKVSEADFGDVNLDPRQHPKVGPRYTTPPTPTVTLCTPTVTLCTPTVTHHDPPCFDYTHSPPSFSGRRKLFDGHKEHDRSTDGHKQITAYARKKVLGPGTYANRFHTNSRAQCSTHQQHLRHEYGLHQKLGHWKARQQHFFRKREERKMRERQDGFGVGMAAPRGSGKRSKQQEAMPGKVYSGRYRVPQRPAAKQQLLRTATPPTDEQARQARRRELQRQNTSFLRMQRTAQQQTFEMNSPGKHPR